MEFTHLKNLNKRKKGDVLVLPYWSGNKKIDPAYSLKRPSSSLFKQVLASKDFKGKEGETLFFLC